MQNIQLNLPEESDNDIKSPESPHLNRARGTITADPTKLTDSVFLPLQQYQPPIEDQDQWLINKELNKKTLNATDWHQYADIAFLVCLSIIGFILLAVSSQKSLSSSETWSELVFNAGFVPAVLAAWAAITGPSSYRKFNLIKVCSGGLLALIGVIIAITGGESSSSIIGTLGTVLIEIGALYFISRLFFLTEDSEREIEKLNKQLKEARQATGAGLALSYFYNFLMPMAKDLTNYENKNDTDKEEMNKYNKRKIIKLTLDKNDKEFGVDEFVLQEAMMTIFVPRTLNKHDMKDTLRGLGKEGCFKYYSGYRAMSVNFLKYWVRNKDNMKCVSGMCCMPTVVSSIYRRWEEVEKRIAAATTREERDAILPIDIEQEILDFQNCLINLINSNEIASKCLRIISIPPLPLTNDDDLLWHAIVAVNEKKVKTKEIKLITQPKTKQKSPK